MTYINNINSENEPPGDCEDSSIEDSELNNKRRRLTKHDKHIIWRRRKIFSLLVQGVTSTYDLAFALHISQSTAARDVQFLKTQATEQMRTHISERLPWEYRICSEGLSEVLKYAWFLILQEDARTNKVAILSLIAQCYKDLLNMSTNATVVTDALLQVEKMKNQILELDSSKVQSSDNK
jgi:hypothetical protein